jgi:hypothetical protein
MEDRRQLGVLYKDSQDGKPLRFLFSHKYKLCRIGTSHFREVYLKTLLDYGVYSVTLCSLHRSSHLLSSSERRQGSTRVPGQCMHVCLE